MKKRLRPVLTSEVKRWRRLLAQGLSSEAVGRLSGRAGQTVRRHADGGPLAGLKRRALRTEALFRDCNRALAEAAR